MSIEDFVKDDSRLQNILDSTKKSLKNAAAVNITRNALITSLQNKNLVVETFSGGNTKWNRVRFHVPKTHALDAVCVGNMNKVDGWENKLVLKIKCFGRGRYQREKYWNT